jgi:hypothetical protein
MTLLLLSVIAGCTGADRAADEAPMAVPEVAPAALVSGSWQVAVAAPGALDALGQQEGWRARFSWDLAGAARAFVAAGDLAAAARAHAEMGAVYRQAALLQANAIWQTYGIDRDGVDQRREGDPAEVDYLLGVSAVVRGDLDAARERLGRSGASAVEGLADADAAWAERVKGADFALTLSSDERIFPLSAPAAGEAPEVPPAPHYLLPETVGELTVKAADPTVTLQLAAWHRAAAEAADPGVAAAVLAPWLLPNEPPLPAPAPNQAALFLSAWPTAADLAWAAGGAAPQGSVYAAALTPCEPELVAHCVQEQAVGLSAQVQAAMAAASGGVNGDHRALALMTRAGLMRAASQIAFRADAIEAGAVLMTEAINFYGDGIDPIFALQTAAWDADRRNALRASELYHGQSRMLPGLDGGRFSLDALSLRVGRDAGPATPSH